MGKQFQVNPRGPCSPQLIRWDIDNLSHPDSDSCPSISPTVCSEDHQLCIKSSQLDVSFLNKNVEVYEAEVITLVCEKIQHYIDLFQPKEKIAAPYGCVLLPSGAE
jgi:hypothetical protein